MLLDFERRRLDEIGREIASDFRELRRKAREQDLPDAGARYSYMFGQLKVICAWLHGQLVEELTQQDRVLAAHKGIEAGQAALTAMRTVARELGLIITDEDAARAAALAALDDDAGSFLGGGV